VDFLEENGDGAMFVNSDVEEDDREEIILDHGRRYVPEHAAFVHWVTKQTRYTALKFEHVMYYGSRPALSQVYGRVCLIVEIGRPGHRGDGELPSVFSIESWR